MLRSEVSEFDTEAALAAEVVAWLQSLRWEVYQEVQPRRLGATCDIVARRDGLVWAIETKLSLSAAVIEQAWRWIGSAHYVAVAVPEQQAYKHRAGRGVLQQFCRDHGVGVLRVRRPSRHFESAREHLRPRLHRRVGDAFTHLREEHKTFAAAGNADGRRFTPFQATCQEIAAFALARPGATLKEAVEGIDHHYRTPSTARSSLAKWIRNGLIPAVRVEIEGGKARVYPATEPAS